MPGKKDRELPKTVKIKFTKHGKPGKKDSLGDIGFNAELFFRSIFGDKKYTDELGIRSPF